MTVVIEATRLAASGLAVFPCRSDKRPATPRGFKDAVAEPGAVADLFRRRPGELVGVATGAASGLAVLDLDAQHDEARAWWQAYANRLPRTRIQRTRSGGIHVYFRHAEGVRCAASRPVHGVDVRAEGGYVVWWHAAGLPCLDDSALAPWPAWLTGLIWPPKPPGPRWMPLQGGSVRAVAGVVRAVRDAPQGARNRLLYWGACRFRERGIARGEAEAELMAAAMQAGLTTLEIQRTLNSAWRAR